MRDFLQLASGDLDLTSGDIAMTEATRQHQRDIILTRPGSMKHAPGRGVGAEDYFNDESPEDFIRKTRQEMVRDGMKITAIEGPITNLTITGYYASDYNR